MSQCKIYGRKRLIEERRTELSDAIHRAATSALGLPAEKRFHRFFPLEDADFVAPPDRTEHYVIIEVLLFEGRSTATKKAFLTSLLSEITALGIAANDLEVTLIESPRESWLIRGLPADELSLNYPVGDEARKP